MSYSSCRTSRHSDDLCYQLSRQTAALMVYSECWSHCDLCDLFIVYSECRSHCECVVECV